MSEWEDFERAVAAFVKALTPGARITHNARLPDRHTGRLRQRDVWIEARIGPFPVAILVSCKRLKRKINEQDLDAFIGELSSSGAHKGVLYSLAGRTTWRSPPSPIPRPSCRRPGVSRRSISCTRSSICSGAHGASCAGARMGQTSRQPARPTPPIPGRKADPRRPRVSVRLTLKALQAKRGFQGISTRT